MKSGNTFTAFLRSLACHEPACRGLSLPIFLPWSAALARVPQPTTVGKEQGKRSIKGPLHRSIPDESRCQIGSARLCVGAISVKRATSAITRGVAGEPSAARNAA